MLPFAKGKIASYLWRYQQNNDNNNNKKGVNILKWPSQSPETLTPIRTLMKSFKTSFGKVLQKKIDGKFLCHKVVSRFDEFDAIKGCQKAQTHVPFLAAGTSTTDGTKSSSDDVNDVQLLVLSDLDRVGLNDSDELFSSVLICSSIILSPVLNFLRCRYSVIDS